MWCETRFMFQCELSDLKKVYFERKFINKYPSYDLFSKNKIIVFTKYVLAYLIYSFEFLFFRTLDVIYRPFKSRLNKFPSEVPSCTKRCLFSHSL